MKRIGTKTRIKLAAKIVTQEIRDTSQRGGRFAGALAGEGYAGGYADALADVLLVLNGCRPDRRGYWVVPDDSVSWVGR